MPSRNEGDDSDNNKDGKDQKGEDNEKPQRPRSKKPLIILGIVVLAGAIIAFCFWFAYRNQVSTDDAYTDGNVVAMAPKVSGYVVELFVNDNSHVRKGDLLLRIEPQDFRTAQANAAGQLALSRAQLKTAETALRIARVQYPAQFVAAQAQQQAAAAVLAQADASYARQHQVDRRATTQENIDTATSQQQSSNANLKAPRRNWLSQPWFLSRFSKP
jgi:membrane fusion protein (multidrug efflux system)